MRGKHAQEGVNMKVVLVNGSRRDAGCTYTALSVVAKELEAQGIETEIVAVGICSRFPVDGNLAVLRL